MKHVKEIFSLVAALTLVVALTGCITRFSIDLWLDPQYERNEVKVVSYMHAITEDGTIIRAVHVEREIKTGETYTHNMFDDPHYLWHTRLVKSGTTDKVVCTFFAPHPGPGWIHTVTLTIHDTLGLTATATITKFI